MEDLGHVKYIFADKTGVLTSNNMKFQSLCVYGESYGNNNDADISNRPTS